MTRSENTQTAATCSLSGASCPGFGIGLWVLVALPAIILAALIFAFGVNVPFYDEWGTPASSLIHAARGTLTIGHLIAQHNESRPLVLRLFSLIGTYFFGWDVRHGMWASFLLACVIAGNLYFLARKNLVDGRAAFSAVFVANCLIFSPAQWENWLMGWQMAVFVPIACLTAALLAIYSAASLRCKFLVGAALSTVSTFSFANGMVCWPLLAPALVASSQVSSRQRAGVLIGWVLLASAILGLYFHGYARPAHHPAFGKAVRHPLATLLYFLSLLGSPLWFQALGPRVLIGAIFLLLFLVACAYVLKNKKDGELRLRALPWLVIGGYAVISCFTIALGRVGFGLATAVAPRYVTHSTYLIVAVVYLARILPIQAWLKGSMRSRVGAASVATLCAVLLVRSFVAGAGKMSELNHQRLFAKSCVLWVNVLKDEECIRRFVYPNPERLIRTANELNDLNLLEPKLIDTARIQSVKQPSDKSAGVFESLLQKRDGRYSAHGWAVLPDSGAPAHAVVLAQGPAGSEVAFALAMVEGGRPDAASVLRQSSPRRLRWGVSFSVDWPLRQPIEISAWAFDATHSRLFMLEQQHVIAGRL